MTEITFTPVYIEAFEHTLMESSDIIDDYYIRHNCVFVIKVADLSSLITLGRRYGISISVFGR